MYRLIFTISILLLLSSFLVTKNIYAVTFSNESVTLYPVQKKNLTLKIKSDSICSGSCFSVLQGETEHQLYSVDHKSKNLESVSVEYSSQPHIIHPSIDVFVVQKVTGVSENSSKVLGSYYDVVIPVFPMDDDIQFSKNTIINVMVSVPVDTEAGEYKGKLIFHFEDDVFHYPISIKVSISILNDYLPPQSYIFDLDENAIKYWYRLTDLDPRYYTLLEKYHLFFKDFGIETSNYPFPAGKDISEIPDVVENKSKGEKYLVFKKENLLEVPVPKYDFFRNGFRLSSRIRLPKLYSGKLFEYKWFNRASGFRLSVVDQKLVLELGISKPLGRVEVERLELPVYKFDKWLDINIEVTFDKKIILSDGFNDVGSSFNGRLSIPYGGAFRIQGGDYSFHLNEIKINYTKSGQNTSNIFGSNDLVKLLRNPVLKKYSRQEYINKKISYIASICPSGKYGRLNDVLNDLDETSFRYPDLDKIIKNDCGFVKMPHDEALEGARAERNIKWSKSINKQFPSLKILHSFGNLGGLKVLKPRKKRIINSYLDSVDVIAVRSKLIDFVENVIHSAGNKKTVEIAPYIHELDTLEKSDGLRVARAYFWKHFSNGYDSMSYWKVNLWFQPSRPGRPERWTSSASDGYIVSKRNPAGIGSGLLVYPGKSGPVASLRLLAIRDGIEDFKLLKSLEYLATKNIEASQLLEEIRNKFSNKQWFSTSDAEYDLIHDYRLKISEMTLNYELRK